MDTPGNTMTTGEFSDTPEQGEKSPRRDIEVTEEARWHLEGLGLGPEIIKELTDIMSEFEYGDAVAYAEWIVANRMAEVYQLADYPEFGDYIRIPAMYEFNDLSNAKGQCSELTRKLRLKLGARGGWLQRANRESSRYGMKELVLHTMLARTPRIFTEGDGPHFLVGLIAREDLLEPEEEYSDEEYDSYVGDEYSEEEIGDEGDDESYEEQEESSEHWEPRYLNIDPSFGVIASSGEGYEVHDAFERLDPNHEDYLEGFTTVDTYSIDEDGVLERVAPAIALRSSKNYEYFYTVGFVRSAPDAPLEPVIGVAKADGSDADCLRTTSGDYVWTADHDDIDEATKREVYQLLEVFSRLTIKQ